MSAPQQAGGAPGAHPSAPRPQQPNAQQAAIAQQKQSTEENARIEAARQAANKAGNSILAKRKIADLVSQVSPGDTVAPEVEEVLLEIAEDFVENVTNFACLLAKHRNSNVLEVQDLRLHLEKNWGIKVPGHTATDDRAAKAQKASGGGSQAGGGPAAGGAAGAAGATGGAPAAGK